MRFAIIVLSWIAITYLEYRSQGTSRSRASRGAAKSCRSQVGYQRSQYTAWIPAQNHAGMTGSGKNHICDSIFHLQKSSRTEVRATEEMSRAACPEGERGRGSQSHRREAAQVTIDRSEKRSKGPCRVEGSKRMCSASQSFTNKRGVEHICGGS